ncbi:hypothetical protein [Nocardioides sp.]|uniref:hypothetical protein n=1 Tax=Nocardioides sp. TaxID=35761 RepID=UPI001A253FBF|nr:hypothetical protein [Nocardioides sp.]MBJ7358016.1 hypothetical protein [Nocardioides sp.]
MYGDSDVVRRHAGRLREQGDDLRALAEQLVARAETLHWSGRAADAMRERVRERAARLREAAARHEAAATSLEVHGTHVDSLKDAILDTERRSRALVADGLLADFDAPAPGHKDWLAVTLPRHSVET